MIKKVVWRIFWILFVILIGVVSIFLIFNSFKIKSQNKSKDYPKPSGISSHKEAKGNKKPRAELETDKFSTKNFYYPLLQPTLKEPEYQGELLPIASTEAKYKQNFIDKNMLPPGSAILTSAGDLGNSGIKAIIHLATRSVDPKNEEFQPRMFFVRSIQQAIILAERSKYKSIAFPLVDIKTLDLILPPEMYGSQAERRSRLAFMVMKAAFSQARNCKKLKKIVFVDYGDKVFLSVWDKIKEKKPNSIREIVVVNGLANLEKTVPRKQGITDFSLHKCQVIVNTTFNVEGKFVGSGGLSGYIAYQTGSAKVDIQRVIEKNITEFNQRLKIN